MSNIRVDVEYTIRDGYEIKFRSPVDCSQITGLIVYYPGSNGNVTSKVFALADAHGNNVGDIDHLFAEDVVVKVILDVTKGMAFVQNADTNAYLEAQLASKAPAGFGLGGYGEWVEDLNNARKNGFYSWTDTALNKPFNYGNLLALNRSNSRVTQIGIDPKMGGFGTIAIRHCTNVSNGDWTGWEYINPVMSLGTEYRTIEMWKGNVVYAKLIDFGALPNNSSKSISIGTGLNIVSLQGVAIGSSFQMDLSTMPGVTEMYYGISTGKIGIATTSDSSAYTNTYILVKYTKG